MTVFKKILGYEQPTSLIKFQVISHSLENMPENLRLTSWIVQDKRLFLSQAPDAEKIADRYVGIKEALPVLRAMMKDGIAIIERHYDLSGEESLLRSLPPKYATRHINSPYDELEMQKGVMVCIVRTLLGDFDFVEHYRSDDTKRGSQSA